MQALVNVLEILLVAVSNWSPETFRQTQWSGVRNALVDVGRPDLAELVDTVVKCMTKPAAAASPSIAAADLPNISSFAAVIEPRPWGKPERGIAEKFGQQFVFLTSIDTASVPPGATGTPVATAKPVELAVADTLLARSGMPGEPVPMPRPRARAGGNLPADLRDSADADDLEGFEVVDRYVRPLTAHPLRHVLTHPPGCLFYLFCFCFSFRGSFPARTPRIALPPRAPSRRRRRRRFRSARARRRP